MIACFGLRPVNVSHALASLLMRNSCRTVTMVPRSPGAVSKITSPALSESPPMERQAMRFPGSSLRISESHSIGLVRIVARHHHPVRGRRAGGADFGNLFLPQWRFLDVAPEVVQFRWRSKHESTRPHPLLSVFVSRRRSIVSVQDRTGGARLWNFFRMRLFLDSTIHEISPWLPR